MVRPLAIACALAIAASAGAAEAGEMPHALGMYTPQGTSLAMVDSDLAVTVRGPIVEVVVTQRFQNRGARPTEATYVFPLPVDAAVSGMEIETGNRTIHAAIAKRAVAQQRYEDAVRAGVAGALLDQERPDVFTQTVAAVPAKGSVAVTLRFDTTARYRDGRWELVLPLVVAPRYVPGTATGRPTTGTGRAPDTDRAPDASRITPAGGPGAGGATAVKLHFIDRVTDLTSPTHELVVGRGGDARFVDAKTDHDAIVRWRSPAPAGGWVEASPDGGYAAVVVEAPPAKPRRRTVRWVLVLDRSAATRGDADAAARPLIRGLFAAMTSADRVEVIGSDRIGWGTSRDVARAVETAWTRPARAFDLTRTLQSARAEGAPLVLVSGGLVADDRAAIQAAAKLGVAVHVIGIGPAPARGVLEGVARASGGTVRYAIPGEDVTAIARSTLADVANPPAPLAVTWGTLRASDVVPGRLPRLGAGQALLVLAKVKRARASNGRARGELFSIEPVRATSVAGATTPMGPLARRWARNRLDELIASHASPAAITAHALRYGLVSPYTSMIAVGTEVVVRGGVRRSSAVPVSVPAGMKWQQVKKEITVDGLTMDGKLSTDDNTVAVRDPKKTKQPRKKPVGRTVVPTTPTTQSPPPVENAPKVEQDKGGFAKRAESDGDAEAGEDLDDEESRAPMAPRAAMIDSGSVAEEVVVTSGFHRRRWRIVASVAGGVARAGGESSSLLAGGARLELALTPHLVTGVDTALWLVDGDVVVGRTLVSLARLGVARWLEVGIGLGFQVGDGAAGPAASASLRFHLPPLPRAATYLRYDTALLYRDATRTGESAATLGLEWSF